MAKAKKQPKNQLSLFAPVMGNSVAAKDQIDLMLYPFFSLSKRKRTSTIRFDDGRVKLVISAQEEHGIANIYDADILIYVASHIMDARNKGLETSPRVKMSQYDILEFLGKGTSGREYKNLKESLERLQSTSISTTITREHSRYKKRNMFSWISEWEVIEKNGKPVAIDFLLSDWLYQGIIEGRVLTLSKKYFHLESGLDKFLYKLCRKIIGNENGVLQMKLSTVHARSGSTRRPSVFKAMIEKIVEEQSVPEHWIFLTQRASTQDWYVCAFDRKYYKSKQEAFENISFIALDRALIKRGGGA